MLRLATPAGRRPQGRRPVAAAGSERDGDRAPVRLVLRFRVPDSTPAGVYDGRLVFARRQRFGRCRCGCGCSACSCPPVTTRRGSARSSSSSRRPTSPPSLARSGLESASIGPGVTDRLFAFLSDYRVSPGDWGFGTPWPDGYVDRPGWSRAAATRMAAEGAYPFSAMRLPLGTQRAARLAHGPVPSLPRGLDRLPDRRVLPFWREHGWLDRALVWGWDEPGPVYGRRLSRRRPAPRMRRAWPISRPARRRGAFPARRVTIPWGQGTRSFTIRAHGEANGFLWDDQGCDDVDIWAVLSRRFYGSFATPVEQARTSTRSASCRAASARRMRGERRSGASRTSRRSGSDRRAMRRRSRRPMRGCSGSGTGSRAWTERSMPMGW